MTPPLYISTGDTAPPATLPEALLRGLAPDGGLYMPGSLPALTEEDLRVLGDAGWEGSALLLARKLLDGSLDASAIEEVVQEAFDFPIPLTPVTERIALLDLSRGPTLAFKDVGARFMARLMSRFRDPASGPLTILTATSGDTGGAVAHAFLGLSGIRVIVLFPDGKVTHRQERQFSTLGGNVHAVAVQGDFDDCQRMAKAAFADLELRKAVSLTSANSINIGRFLPQSFYYAFAWGQVNSGRLELPGPRHPVSGAAPVIVGPGKPILFSVPSGNFGNLAAGLLARAMGLPRVRFLAATNANDVVPELLRTGHFRPRPSRRTLSTAMDVGNPSNLARILHLYGGDLDRIRRDVTGRSVDDDGTRATIRRVHEDTGHILDPHTAVGFQALVRELEERPGVLGVLVGTAHPAKFAEVVEPAVGTTLPVPEALARGLRRERRVTSMEPRPEELRSFITALAG